MNAVVEYFEDSFCREGIVIPDYRWAKLIKVRDDDVKTNTFPMLDILCEMKDFLNDPRSTCMFLADCVLGLNTVIELSSSAKVIQIQRL